ncbi:hypothetical protein SH661x_001130 [Planctomicrobium sp. SH661]|uniref:hypothetical protein n=1 Tax=Planctomicrobium sp. SH661 TaxID=3448124 RepID=UPI003F5C91C6
MKIRPALKPGDPVIYRMTKHSQCPGPRAKSVAPSPNGDEYKYQVDKFWVVEKVLEDGQVQLRTRRGKTRTIRQDDQNLRPPAWWEVLLYRNYFPQLGQNSQT